MIKREGVQSTAVPPCLTSPVRLRMGKGFTFLSWWAYGMKLYLLTLFRISSVVPVEQKKILFYFVVVPRKELDPY